MYCHLILKRVEGHFLTSLLSGRDYWLPKWSETFLSKFSRKERKGLFIFSHFGGSPYWPPFPISVKPNDFRSEEKSILRTNTPSLWIYVWEQNIVDFLKWVIVVRRGFSDFYFEFLHMRCHEHPNFHTLNSSVHTETGLTKGHKCSGRVERRNGPFEDE